MLQHTIAIYGGSFDPPHMGHQFACLHLLEALGAQAVWLIPAYEHFFGKRMSGFAHRLEMCERLALPFNGRVVVSKIEEELVRSGSRGKTYELIKYLQTQYPAQKFALVIGSDILQNTQTWFKWDEITQMLPIVVIGREGYEGGEISLPDISSTEVRSCLALRSSVQGLVPLSVLEYISAQSLYVNA
jgi:nicotinate-nucleotide adenylyltransferase